jgi:ABC-type glutathione transport system ATPase component
MTALIEFRQVSKEFKLHNGGRLLAVKDFSMVLEVGKTVGLVGGSGSGKSTVALMALALAKPDAGAILWGGTDIWSVKSRQRRELRRHCQIVFQDPRSSLDPRLTVEEVVAEPLVVHGIGSKEERVDTIRAAIEMVGLAPDIIHAVPRQLSGGEAQRVSIARAIVLRPSVVVLDEALSSLDLSVQAQVINLLLQLQRDLNLSYLFISHDLALVANVSDSIIVMQKGSIVEAGDVDQIYGAPKHPYTQALLSAVEELDTKMGYR